jgi:hypothetical protein
LADDFKASDIDIVPTAEPDMVAEMEKMMKANSLMQHRANGVPLNVEAVTRRVLEAEGHENVQELMQAPPPQIPPEVQLEQQRFEHQKQMDGLKARLDQLRTEAEVQMMTMDAMLKMAQARKESTDGLHAQFIAQQKQTKDEFEAVTKRLKVLIDGKNNQQAGEQAEGSTGGSE